MMNTKIFKIFNQIAINFTKNRGKELASELKKHHKNIIGELSKNVDWGC